MNRHRSLQLIALLSLSTLALGTIGCSQGSSPTEPAFTDDATAFSTTASSTAALTDDNQTRGNDDNGGDNRGGKGGKGGKGGGKAPRAGKEFEGAVTAAGQSSLTLAGGTRIVVNAQTRWEARGDLHSLAQIARSVAAGRPTRAEGRGTRQADGSLLALTLKAEVD